MRKVYVLQTRWLGMDDWMNAVYVAETEEAAFAQALAAEQQAESEDAEEEGREPREWASLDDLRRDSDNEFWFGGWFVAEGGEV